MARENNVKPLWILVAIYAIYIPLSIAQVLPPLVDTNIGVFLPAIFALWHGAVRYKWRGSIIFFVICFVVSNIFENMGVATGFPFGPYHYDDHKLGPKLFLVPLLIGPGYYGTGYVSWMLGSLIVGDEVKRRASKFTTFVVPFVATFIMVAWDICFDPDSSTLNGDWIWHKGGGYFGVPLTNYLGWFLTVYVFLQIIALYYRKTVSDDEPPLPKVYWWQAIAFYFLIGVGYLLTFFVAEHGTMTDPRGVVWRIHDFRETSALMFIYTMLFAVVIASVKLIQRREEA